MFNDSVTRRTARYAFAPGQMLRALQLDGPLLAGLMAIAVIGLFVLYSASGESQARLVSQVVRLLLALFAMVLMAHVPPKLLRTWSPWLYLAGLALLAIVLFAGSAGKGAQRWIEFAGTRFQPSEVMKLALPMAMAWYLHERPLPPTIWPLFVLCATIIVPTVMIARQPDLGTALLVACAGVFVVLLAGVRKRIIFLLLALVLGAIPVLWYSMLDYQRQRVLTFLNPERDPLGTGYHIIQSKIAIGSGGLFGKGWLNGSQAQLEFLPERSTDFIFAVLGEEFGLMGLLVILALYLFVIGRGLYIAVHAQDTFSRLVAGSITLTFFVYVFVNMGMVSGLLPVVGVPLPLVSYGGTSMVTLMAGFGILMSIQTHRKLLST